MAWDFALANFHSDLFTHHAVPSLHPGEMEFGTPRFRVGIPVVDALCSSEFAGGANMIWDLAVLSLNARRSHILQITSCISDV